MDALRPERQSQATCGWIRKGEIKTLSTTNKQSRMHFIGAIALENMKVIAQEYKTIDTESVIKFFKDLEASSTASKIHIICDNGEQIKIKPCKSISRRPELKYTICLLILLI